MTLSEVTKGDRVIRTVRKIRGGRDARPEIVSSVTDKGIRCGDTWYDFSGRSIRGYGREMGHAIRVPEQGELEAFDARLAEDTRLSEQAAQEKLTHEATEPHRLAERLGWIEHEKWEAIPIQTLRQIANLAGIEQ